MGGEGGVEVKQAATWVIIVEGKQGAPGGLSSVESTFSYI